MAHRGDIQEFPTRIARVSVTVALGKISCPAPFPHLLTAFIPQPPALNPKPWSPLEGVGIRLRAFIQGCRAFMGDPVVVGGRDHTILTYRATMGDCVCADLCVCVCARVHLCACSGLVPPWATLTAKPSLLALVSAADTRPSSLHPRLWPLSTAVTGCGPRVTSLHRRPPLWR